MRVIGTAGHVDHGKSTLVHALTGTDPDRLSEEKARGLTIDLGFASMTLPSGAEIGFVDVPGHVRFITNMLAGAGGVDACVFVVAATEGWKPQSEEHLRILSLLGIRHGLIALTKVALVDDEWRDLAALDVTDHVAGTFLEGAELVFVDARSGVGLDGPSGLIAALDRLVAVTPAAPDRQRPRLWIDRAFSARGSGTVVTGSLAGGSLSLEDEVLIEPGGHRARVRALQTHNRPLEHAEPGRRLAVNLAGVDHDRVRRGQALVRPGQWHLTRVVDASLSVLPALGYSIGRRGAYAVYVGSGKHPARLRVLGPGAGALTPGAMGAVRLWLGQPLPLVAGDRYVLRESGRAETVGGGEILDVAPVLPASRAAPDRSVARIVAERGWIEAAELERLTGEVVAATVGPWVVDPAALATARRELRAAVEGAGSRGIDLASLDARARALLPELGGVEVHDTRVSVAGTAAHVADVLARHPFVAACEASPFAPPDPNALDPAELRDLARHGLLIECNGVWFAATAVQAAAKLLAELFATGSDGVTVAAVRDALGTTRKHALPLLAYFDSQGVTRRRGDLRVPGPRLPG